MIELIEFLGWAQNNGGLLVLLVLLFVRQEHIMQLFERHERDYHFGGVKNGKR